MSDKPTVLMVDDDEDFRTIVRGWLSPRYEVCTKADGEDLLEDLGGLEPDAVILDVRLPGPDGFTLCKAIRSDPRFGEVPVLFLTGCKDDEDFVKNMDAGGTAYLTKPVERRRLLSKLRELLRDVIPR